MIDIVADGSTRKTRLFSNRIPTFRGSRKSGDDICPCHSPSVGVCDREWKNVKKKVPGPSSPDDLVMCDSLSFG